MNNKFFIDFRDAKNLDDLTLFIGINKNLFEEVVKQSKSEEDLSKPSLKTGFANQSNKIDSTNDRYIKSNLYELIKIPKKRKSTYPKWREVFEIVNPELADGYKTFARRFELFVQNVNKDFPHCAAYGYVRGKNILENATKHCGAKFLLRADISNFFPSITDVKLIESFTKLGLCKVVSEALAAFVTIDGKLPLGFHSSPMLANLVCLDMDKKLLLLSEKYGCKYTRYADDISISGTSILPSKIEIDSILKEDRFLLSIKKFRITKLGQAHYVTGLSISDFKRPHVPKKIKKNLRQELYFCKKFGIKKHINNLKTRDKNKDIYQEINRIDGMIRYVSYIEKLPNLTEDWKYILKKDGLKPSYMPREGLSKKVEFYFDETLIEFEQKKFLAIAVVTTEESSSIESRISVTLDSHIRDPFSTNKYRKKILEKEKLHYNASNEDLKTKFISVLVDYNFKGYLIYKELKDEKDYENIYLSLLKKLIPDRFIKCDGSYIELFFEENSKVKLKNIKIIINEIYNNLISDNSRRPIDLPITKSAKKQNCYCLSIPDYLLGVFTRYSKLQYLTQDLNEKNFKERDKNLRSEHQFEKLRDKYRRIIDDDSGIQYSRKRPFLPWKFLHKK